MRAAVLLAASLPVLAPAQEPARERPTPEEAVRQKLASPFLRHADWTTDYGEALARAADEEKLVLAYFTTAYY